MTEHDAAAKMLDGHGHPLWSDLKLDNELTALLGGSREAFCTLAESIDGKLGDIERESQGLGTIVDANSVVITQSLLWRLVR